MSTIRYMTQPTDMDGKTFRSCLVGFTPSFVQSPECLPESERSSTNMWSDNEGNNVAVEVWDQMDEWGRYHRVRRWITVPDLDPEEYGYRNGVAVQLGDCETCHHGDLTVQATLSHDPCNACEWTDYPTCSKPMLSGYELAINIVGLGEHA